MKSKGFSTRLVEHARISRGFYISQALEYQKQRGIDATTSVWSAVTGSTNGVSIVAEFDTLAELEKFDEMAVTDNEFGKLRKATRESMVFLTSHVELMRNLV